METAPDSPSHPDVPENPTMSPSSELVRGTIISPEVTSGPMMSPPSSSEGSTADEEGHFLAETPRRRHRHKKRPSYQVSGGRRIRISCMRRDEGDEVLSDSEEECFSSQSAAGGLSSRDLSPVEAVREYLVDCKGEMVEDFERIMANLGSVTDRAIASGVTIVQRTAEGGKHIYERTAAGGKEIVVKSRRVAKEVTEVPGKVVGKVVNHWNHLSFAKLPAWMRDNEYIQFNYRPELNSFSECFKSILGVHSETGNIWTHLIGSILFIIVTIVFYVKPLCDYCHTDLAIGEKLIFLFFFLGAIFCLGLSFLFHTVCCHSESVSRLFCKLDYLGISLLTVGSFVPWIYYGFYCQFTAKVVYLTTISVLAVVTIVVTMFDAFSGPEFRVVRSVVFVALGGFGFVPSLHFLIQSGWSTALVEASIHRVMIMGGLYILGAILYGARIPERFLPGKCDIWFQSHQIFHVLVIAAALVHYHGMSNMAVYRLTKGGSCIDAGVQEPNITSEEVVFQ